MIRHPPPPFRSAAAISGKLAEVNSSTGITPPFQLLVSSVRMFLAGTVWKRSRSTHLDADYPAPSRNGLRQGVFLGPEIMREINDNPAVSRDLLSVRQVPNLIPNLIF